MRGPLALGPSLGLRQASRGPQVRTQADGHLAQVFGSCWQLEESFPAFCFEHRLDTKARMRGFHLCVEQGSNAADMWGQGGQDFLPVHQTAEK